MRKNSTDSTATPVLLQTLITLLMAHRSAFKQERPFRRAVALVFGEVFAFARHTVTQSLLALGLTDADWTAWYRLFSRERFDEAALTGCLFRETLAHVAVDEPYVIGVDGTQIPRTSHTMVGTGWLRAPRTAVFKRGIHRAQRFVHGAWLTPIQEGYARAIPLRFLPAFPQKAVRRELPARKEWEAGLEFVAWVRRGLDQAGRVGQRLIVLGDGAYDTLDFWRGLPPNAIAIVRTARNRKLREPLPAEWSGDKRRKYGPQAPRPEDWLAQRKGWLKTMVDVRGRAFELRYRILGPYVRERAAERPLFLIVIGGAVWKAGKKEPRRARRRPSFYLVSAIQRDGVWQMPLDAKQVLEWVWQRWELEVAHREMKSSFGVGEKQCFSPRAAVVSVQWSVWVYGVLVLAGYRAWGLFGGPPTPARWWGGARRWSFTTLWRSYRAALWGTTEFRAVWTQTSDNWPAKEAALTALANAVAGAARA